NLGVIEEFYAEFLRLGGKGIGKLEAVAGLVLRGTQAADDLFAHMRERRLDLDAAVAIEHLVRNAVGSERLDVLGGRVELRLSTEQLQRSLHALVIGDARLL